MREIYTEGFIRRDCPRCGSILEILFQGDLYVGTSYSESYSLLILLLHKRDIVCTRAIHKSRCFIDNNTARRTVCICFIELSRQLIVYSAHCVLARTCLRLSLHSISCSSYNHQCTAVHCTRYNTLHCVSPACTLYIVQSVTYTLRRRLLVTQLPL